MYTREPATEQQPEHCPLHSIRSVQYATSAPTLVASEQTAAREIFDACCEGKPERCTAWKEVRAAGRLARLAKPRSSCSSRGGRSRAWLHACMPGPRLLLAAQRPFGPPFPSPAKRLQNAAANITNLCALSMNLCTADGQLAELSMRGAPASAAWSAAVAC
jgi:hypothetical protein